MWPNSNSRAKPHSSATSRATGDVSIEGLAAVLHAKVKAADRNDLHDVDALLMAQAVALNSMFAGLIQLGRKNLSKHFDGAERLMRLGLKAQSQSRAALETLAAIKSPPNRIRTASERRAWSTTSEQPRGRRRSDPCASRARGRFGIRAEQTIGASWRTAGRWSGGRDRRGRSDAGDRGSGPPARGRLKARRDRRGTLIRADSGAGGVKSLRPSTRSYGRRKSAFMGCADNWPAARRDCQPSVFSSCSIAFRSLSAQ
jgi:hypothetical protein